MKKACIILGLMLFFLMEASVAYGGTLNSYEKELLGVAKAQFKYYGKVYEAGQEYIDQLESYLSSGDVDLSEAQKDAAISKIYENVATGIKEGYLIPIETPSASEKAIELPEETEASEITPTTTVGTDVPEITVTIPTLGIELEDTIIKNTGFNLNTTIMVAVGVVVLMLICMLVTNRYNLFAPTDE